MNLGPDITRDGYHHLVDVETRWADNDLYGHVNNATYYAYFDTVVNNYLIEQGGLDIFTGPVIGVAVETMCRFRQSVAYPDIIEIGLSVGKLGNSSVRYDLAVFRKGASDGAEQAVASGHFVHVFVDRATNKPVPVPTSVRAALERLTV